MELYHRLTALLALIVVAAVAGAAEQPALKSGVFSPPRVAPDFSLQGSDGTELKLSRYRGKVVALGFGYTFCPDVCPTTLVDLAAARKKLGAAGENFQVVYITVDPERDSVKQLRDYLAHFDPTFVGATGTPEQLAGVRKAYGILVSKKTYKDSKTAYLVHHSSFVYLIDAEGKLRSLLPFGRSVDDITHDIKTLMKQ